MRFRTGDVNRREKELSYATASAYSEATSVCGKMVLRKPIPRCITHDNEII